MDNGKMKLGVLTVALLALAAQSSSGDTMLIWSYEAKACGNWNYRPSYTLEAIPGSDPARINQKRKAIEAEAKAANKGFVWKDTVPRDRCVAVAYMDRKVGSCSYRTYTWEIGADESAVVTKIGSKIRSTAGVTGSALAEVRCGGVLLPPKSGDTAIGVRG
jgi:hypothetical protein